MSRASRRRRRRGRAPAEPAPFLVVRAGSTWPEGAPALALLPPLAAAAFLVLAKRGALPWLPDVARDLLFHRGWAAGVLGLSGVASGVAAWLLRRAMRGAGRVAFTTEHLSVSRMDEQGRLLEPERLAWSSLAGYRDAAAGQVMLVRRDGGAPVAVPTPTESLRTGVLAALDRLGLTRLDA